MSIGQRGQNLIFLISQPRSGSTLFQRILGNHPDIHTVSEPWLMLQPLDILRAEGYQAEYDSRVAQRALRDFFQTLPGGKDDYVEGVRRMYVYLYQRALASSGKRCFLDKTPRYYLIIPELYRVFPQARYIILLRNPLAVLCSIYKNRGRYSVLSRHGSKLDLIKAPSLVLQGIELLGEQSAVIHYEQLVKGSEQEIQKLCNKLEIDFDPAMIEYGHHTLPHWTLGDTKVYNHARPIAQVAEEWIETIADPQAWRLANRYLDLLGQRTVEQMGYSYRELRQTLETHRPHRMQLCFTFSLDWWLKKPAQERTKWEYRAVRLAHELRWRGFASTMVAAIQNIVQALLKAARR